MSGRLLVNGRIWEGEMPAEWREEVLLLPLSVVAERLGARLEWHACGEELEIEKDGSKLTISASEKTALWQGEKVPTGGPIHLKQGMIMVPVSLICRYFHLTWTYVEDVDTVVLSRQEPGLKGKRILLDPGHGGADPGGVGGDLVEAELNWDVAWRLAELLRLSGAEVEYTRLQGETMSVSRRVDGAIQAGADLLISIHHNSFIHAELNGTETYWYHNWSAHQLAKSVQNHLLEELETANRGVREAAFYLLRHVPVVPILVKVGFVTGSHDNAVLADRWMRERAALGIFRGIREYTEGSASRL
jgi:N-acetylmuramoyl-L-alanine amidase